MSGFSSSSLLSGTLDCCSSLGTIGIQSHPWLYSLEASEVYTSAESFERATQETRSNSLDKPFNTADLLLIPVAVLSKLRYRQMTTPAHENRPRLNSADPMQLELTAPLASLPTQRIAHVDLLQQNRGRSISRSA